MMALLSPKVWLAIIVAVLLAASHTMAYKTGASMVRGKWDAAIVAQQAQAAAQEVENRRMENNRQTNVIEAQNAQAKRTQNLQVAAAGARAESSGLRDDIAAIRASLPSTPGDAASNAASTASGLLADCSATYQELAATADRIESDRKTLTDAWPK